jgi:glycosyltransferase involved in cell wall biosynthesis
MTRRLRIAQIAPIAAPVVPGSTRSIEQLVYLLTEELVRRGHDVTLFATGDSRSSAALHAIYPYGYDEDNELWNWEFHESLNAAAAFEQAERFDVIHSHVYHYALPFTRLTATPVVHSYHILPDDDIAAAYARYPEAHVVAISQYQRGHFRRPLAGTSASNARDTFAVVYHGIDTDAFPFNPKRGDHVLFLGQITPDKGPDKAIRLARRAGVRLVLAGPYDEKDEGFFQTEIAPALGPEVEYVGRVDVQRRNRLLAGAAALIYPLDAPEPFGLVTVEAMACGTPVAALSLGAVPEIVDNGVTGYHAPDEEALAGLLPATLALDRTGVRRACVFRFDYRRMVDEYLAIYQSLAVSRVESTTVVAGITTNSPDRRPR